jgi:hypothetical protein
MIAGAEIDRHIGPRIAGQQRRSEHPILDVGLSNSGFGAIRSLWPMGVKEVTLEDLSYFERDEIAGLDGVGKVTMKTLDGAMADAGLTWTSSS